MSLVEKFKPGYKADYPEDIFKIYVFNDRMENRKYCVCPLKNMHHEYWLGFLERKHSKIIQEFNISLDEK